MVDSARAVPAASPSCSKCQPTAKATSAHRPHTESINESAARRMRGSDGSKAWDEPRTAASRELDMVEKGDVASETQDMEGVGRFGWVTDPEGSRIELWQPA